MKQEVIRLDKCRAFNEFAMHLIEFIGVNPTMPTAGITRHDHRLPKSMSQAESGLATLVNSRVS